jgi:hypothetical protein
MSVKNMHYDFKKKFNKIDSQKNRNLLIPEIDWAINEAVGIFVKNIAAPRKPSLSGFELNQRSIDDIKALVKVNQCLSVVNNVVELPEDYMFFKRARVKVNKNGCDKEVFTFSFDLEQQDDEFEESEFYKSSSVWETVTGYFFNNNIQLHDDGTFTNVEFCMNYVMKHVYIHNAEDFRNGTYNLPDGTVLTGFQDCILDEHTHPEIIDLAVAIAAGEVASPDYNIRKDKLTFNN